MPVGTKTKGKRTPVVKAVEPSAKVAARTADDKRWEELLASEKSQEFLKKMAAKVREARDQESGEELDIDQL